VTSALIAPVIPPRSAPALSWTKASSSIASLRKVCWNLAVWLIRPPLAVQATIPSSCRGRALHPPDGGRGFWWDLLGLSAALRVVLVSVRLPLQAGPRASRAARRAESACPVLVLCGLRRGVRHLREDERQLVPAGDDHAGGRVGHLGLAGAGGILGMVIVRRVLFAALGLRLPERVTATSCRSCWWPPSSWSECCQGTMPVRASLSSRWPGWVVRLSRALQPQL
jgi:hypothetical protein